MPKAKVASTLSGLIHDSDSDHDTQMPTPDSASEKQMIPLKKAARANAVSSSKVTKSKVPARRASIGKSLKKAVVPKKRGRPALATRVNLEDAGNETEEVDEFDQLENDLLNNTIMTDAGDELSQPQAAENRKPGRQTQGKSGVVKVDKIKGAKLTAAKVKTAASSRVTKTTQPPAKKSARSKVAQVESMIEERIIQETQPDHMDIDQLDESGIEENAEGTDISAIDETMQQVEPSPKPAKKSGRLTKVVYPVHQQSTTTAPVRRVKSTSTAETMENDPTLRRKLGDLTQKLESSELRYQNLREVGIVQAEAKFDQLKKQSELSARTASSLIAALKSTNVAQEAQIKEFKSLKRQLGAQSTELERLQAEIIRLNASLSDAQRTNKNLSTTLAAKRVAASTVESAEGPRIPGSAMKPGVVRMIGSQEAAESAEKASLKEDLYGDLTGLLIRSVKRNEEDDVYDCIQTGRNGSKFPPRPASPLTDRDIPALHFKLSISNERSADSYDDAQCSYEPQLDASRDRDLIEMLSEEADYLCEQICFPRPQAATFYGRMVKALTERRR